MKRIILGFFLLIGLSLSAQKKVVLPGITNIKTGRISVDSLMKIKEIKVDKGFSPTKLLTSVSRNGNILIFANQFMQPKFITPQVGDRWYVQVEGSFRGKRIKTKEVILIIE